MRGPAGTKRGRSLSFLRCVPVVCVLAAASALAWLEGGSIDAAHWLPYALLTTLLLGAVVASGAGSTPNRLALAGGGALAGLAGWEAVSLLWSPVPSLARDEALLTAFYLAALTIALLTLVELSARLVAIGCVGAAAAILPLGTAAGLLFGLNPDKVFEGGRLSFPVSYSNAAAASFLIGFWPAAVLAARRELAPPARALALSGAILTLGGWLLTQSKGGGIALGLSAIAFFALCPGRLRALVPVLLAGLPVAVAARPLTAPFRADSAPELATAAHDAAVILLVLAGVGAAIGLVYALIDNRLVLPSRAVRIAGAGTVALLAAAVAAGVAAFFVAVDHPGAFAEKRWRSFKHLPTHEATSTHLLSLGSNRYDFWRVALKEFEHHPIAGIGSRGFATAYLEQRRSNETPARAHSLELDTLAELGLVGLALLTCAIALPLVLVARRMRRGDAVAAAVFGGSSYFLIHASADWLWTFPALGVPFFVLLGTGAASGRPRALPPTAAVLATAAAIAVALLAMAPPWLSTRFATHALEDPGSAKDDLRWARRLDPLSVEPLVDEAALAATPSAALPPLREAVRMQPRSAELYYALGLAYLRAGNTQAARQSLATARRLDPGDLLIGRALRRLPPP